jgi:hypothetical protein
MNTREYGSNPKRKLVETNWSILVSLISKQTITITIITLNHHGGA